MNRTYINEVQKEIGNTVKVQGFIENLRNSKYMAFIVLKDITGKLQITVEKEDHPDLVDTIDHTKITWQSYGIFNGPAGHAETMPPAPVQSLCPQTFRPALAPFGKPW